MKLQKVTGATSEIWQIFIRDSSSTTGAGLTGLTNASSSLTAYYHRDTDTTATAISLVTMTVGTFTSSGFKEIDATNMPGWYQLCPPNAALASGAKSVGILLKGATNMAPLPIEVQLTAVNPDSATAFITGVNSLAPPTNWNLISIDGSGVVKANLAQILATALTETSGQLAGAFKKWFDVAAPVGTVNSIPNATAGAAGGLFIAGANAATSITSALTANITGNLSGSVGSVTGAVGSVTGAVSSVTGSVGSVVGLTASNLDATISSRMASTAQIEVKTNTALSNFEFLMTDLTDHNPMTGLTVTTTRSIDGGVFAASTNSASQVGSGIYKIDLSAADLNGRVITLQFVATGADTRFVTILTQA